MFCVRLGHTSSHPRPLVPARPLLRDPYWPRPPDPAKWQQDSVSPSHHLSCRSLPQSNPPDTHECPAPQIHPHTHLCAISHHQTDPQFTPITFETFHSSVGWPNPMVIPPDQFPHDPSPLSTSCPCPQTPFFTFQTMLPRARITPGAHLESRLLDDMTVFSGRMDSQQAY